MRYAANSGVSVERSKGELDTLLGKAGAQQRPGSKPKSAPRKGKRKARA